MQIYTGIDIVENIRIKKALRKHGDRFLKRVFTENEISYCFEKADSISCLAARFAAKEAFIKAFSQAFGINLSLKSIEIKGFQGKHAEILLHPSDKRVESLLKRIKYTFSISHEKNYSVASVIIYTD
ncbi:holo-ACP synthase [Persephonella sp.]|jgi:holo-[acyl-carrier protein] synthase